MKRFLLIGLLPLVIGILYNAILVRFTVPGLIQSVLAVGLLIVWGYLAYILLPDGLNLFLASFCMCSFGLIMLILNLYQSVIVGEYWSNVIGLGSQFFFLPWLAFNSSIMVPIITLFRGTITVLPIFSLTWIELYVVACIGCYIKSRKTHDLH